MYYLETSKMSINIGTINTMDAQGRLVSTTHHEANIFNNILISLTTVASVFIGISIINKIRERNARKRGDPGFTYLFFGDV